MHRADRQRPASPVSSMISKVNLLRSSVEALVLLLSRRQSLQFPANMRSELQAVGA